MEPQIGSLTGGASDADTNRHMTTGQLITGHFPTAQLSNEKVDACSMTNKITSM